MAKVAKDRGVEVLLGGGGVEVDLQSANIGELRGFCNGKGCATCASVFAVKLNAVSIRTTAMSHVSGATRIGW